MLSQTRRFTRFPLSELPSGLMIRIRRHRIAGGRSCGVLTKRRVRDAPLEALPGLARVPLLAEQVEILFPFMAERESKGAPFRD